VSIPEPNPGNVSGGLDGKADEMKDLFSNQAGTYAAFRPTYPDELYQFIYSRLHHFDAAWDCGTGNGQVARDLAKKFRTVFATDISAKQLGNAYPAENIRYSQAGEETTFKDNSMDLITVAQAIHWFDREKFYKEVRRVAKEDALLAVWGYGLLSINSELDLPLRDFYYKQVGPYWDPERKLIDEQYRTISFPFSEINVPRFNFYFEWTIEEFLGYLNTWSSVQNYKQINGINPVDELAERILPMWGPEKRTITFPLFARFGEIG